MIFAHSTGTAGETAYPTGFLALGFGVFSGLKVTMHNTIDKQNSLTCQSPANGTPILGSASDAATIEENFPFTCTTAASTGAPLKLLSAQTEMKVDTSSWHGEPDEDEAP